MDNEQTPHPHGSLAKNITIAVLILLLVAAAGSATYIYRDRQAKKQAADMQATINQLQSQVSSLQAELAASKATSTTTTPSAATLENIQAAITSGNTAALEGYMAPSVTVIIAASEGMGNRTPLQAISDLAYIKNLKNWDFNLPATTLKQYQAGEYKTYFKANSLVGKSSDGHVVAVNFNDQGKINGIFMAVNADLLK